MAAVQSTGRRTVCHVSHPRYYLYFHARRKHTLVHQPVFYLDCACARGRGKRSEARCGARNSTVVLLSRLAGQLSLSRQPCSLSVFKWLFDRVSDLGRSHGKAFESQVKVAIEQEYKPVM